MTTFFNYILIQYNLSVFHLQAPEELCAHACSLQLDWRFLQQILKLYTAVLQETQKEAELLHASDQKGNQDAFLLGEKSFLPGAFCKPAACAVKLQHCSQESRRRIRSFWRFWYQESEVLPNIVTKDFLMAYKSKLQYLTGEEQYCLENSADIKFTVYKICHPCIHGGAWNFSHVFRVNILV